MLASRRVYALLFHPQPLHWHAADDVRLHDLSHVFWLHASVPDGLRIDDYIRTMLALVEASCLIRTHGRFQTSRSDRVFESLVQLSAAAWIAAPPRTSRLPLIGTYKDVVSKSWHC